MPEQSVAEAHAFINVAFTVIIFACTLIWMILVYLYLTKILRGIEILAKAQTETNGLLIAINGELDRLNRFFDGRNVHLQNRQE